jgi:hypothetical protein
VGSASIRGHASELTCRQAAPRPNVSTLRDVKSWNGAATPPAQKKFLHLPASRLPVMPPDWNCKITLNGNFRFRDENRFPWLLSDSHWSARSPV